MRKGDKVKIYDNPLTGKGLEGEAVLIKRLGGDKLFETWQVKFPGDDLIVTRRILKKSYKILSN